MNAAPADQRRLLDIAELDTRIRRARASRENPPQAARVRELTAQRQAQSQELAARAGTRDAVRGELSRLEADVAVVKARRERDRERLNATASAKDAQALESELTALARRESELDDLQLDAMERLEEAEAALAEQQALVQETNDEGAKLSADARELIARAHADEEAAGRDRAAVADEIPADLLAAYDRAAIRSAGAALLRARTCEGCRMLLAGSDLRVLRETAADEVVTCPECGAILIRTEESGL